MKIVDRLYIKVILIAIILIIVSVMLYLNNIQHTKDVVKKEQCLKNLENKYQTEVKELKEVKNKYQKEIKSLNKAYQKEIKTLVDINVEHINKVQNISQKNETTNTKEVVIIKHEPCKKIKESHKIKDTKKDIVASNNLLKQKYQKMIMKNIHHQVLEELKYAPYLPTSQLQEMMDKRFILDDMSFKICIHDDTKESFSGMVIDTNKTRSVTDVNRLIEIKFDSK